MPASTQLAIVTMCDHCTRVKVGGSRQDPDSRILGLLLGYQDGLQVSITDAVELRVSSAQPQPLLLRYSHGSATITLQ
eukprot:11237-Eustigmatos_ZCMA.PRE.1